MRLIVWALVAMYVVAVVCLFASFRIPKGTLIARVNEFIGVALGSFATGLVFLVVTAVLFPQESAAVRALREARQVRARAESLAATRIADSARADTLHVWLTRRVDGLTARLDSLTKRKP